jgi:hypothetical protein
MGQLFFRLRATAAKCGSCSGSWQLAHYGQVAVQAQGRWQFFATWFLSRRNCQIIWQLFLSRRPLRVVRAESCAAYHVAA